MNRERAVAGNSQGYVLAHSFVGNSPAVIGIVKLYAVISLEQDSIIVCVLAVKYDAARVIGQAVALVNVVVECQRFRFGIIGDRAVSKDVGIVFAGDQNTLGPKIVVSGLGDQDIVFYVRRVNLELDVFIGGKIVGVIRHSLAAVRFDACGGDISVRPEFGRKGDSSIDSTVDRMHNGFSCGRDRNL